MQPFTRPVYIFFLTVPAGLSQGFVTVALPYILTQHGFTIAQSATVVALGFSANLWRFVWGPVVDISLSLKKWYWISLLLSISSLLLLCFNSFDSKQQTYLTILVFISQVASTFMLLPVNGMMAKRIQEHEKGKASGWYQAGSLIGVGMGGGAGLWLTTHYSIPVAGIALSIASVVFALVMVLIKDIAHDKTVTMMSALAGMGKDIVSMIKTPAVLFVAFLIALPIGSGAAANLWSAIATDWHTDADTVALVTGILSGVVSAVGCVVGGMIIDKWGNWVAYLGAGTICAVIAGIMALLPMQPSIFVAGVLTYTFGIGLINAAFTSVILYAVGKKNVATKFSLLASLGNLPVVYMTAFDGWAHDTYNSKYMLLAEAAIGIAAVLIASGIAKAMKKKKLLPATIE